MSDTDHPKGLLARGLKALGHLTHPDTRSGRVFTRAEQGLTRVLARVTESPTYLRASGTLMRQGFNARIRRNSFVEGALRSLRLPTSSEVEHLRDQLRRMNDQVEALGSQLEVVVDLLHKQEATSERRSADKDDTQP
ncbi:hypothetical protein LY474_24240 [Myxococcus stipitatus]|uniref:hypothetical protein n=1 Tax=Myxococcus stipitatus TaxID=83455 RepID=UPI001F35F40B|nr:hypothetical protein [Myxococcus stipitatus]MCE9670923.1 hypothetical protein [Myxococcus stipitatus]